MDELKRLQNLITKYLEQPISINPNNGVKQIISIDDDINNIIDVDFNSEIINSFSISDREKNDLLFIQKMILARRNGMYFELTEEQEKLVNIFVLKAKSINEKETAKLNNLDIACEKILDKIKNHEPIDEIDTITTLFESMDLPMIRRNKIMIDLLEYNYRTMQQLIDSSSKIELPLINEDELKTLLMRYAYDFDQISPANLKHILQNGNYQNIEEILEELRTGDYNFISNDSKLFSMILAYSNSDVLKNLKSVSLREKFSLKNLSNITSIFLPKAEKDQKSSLGNNIILRGYENFLKIVDILKKQNISVRDVVRKCNHLFRISASKIEENITSFKLYRLNDNREIGMSTFTWMGSTNLMETCDKYIELGMYDYARHFPSRLKNVDDLFFYRIYYAQNEGLPYYKYTEGSGETFCLKGEVSGLGDAFGIYDKKDALKKCNPVDIPKNDMIQSLLKDNPNNKLDVVFNVQTLKDLDIYKKNIFTYDFDGKLISRLKVLRLANTLLEKNIPLDESTILYLITYQTILNEDELLKIKKCINALGFERRTLS